MKRYNKQGFTLVEALLAIATIGTIAALVLPPLITGAQNKKHAASLGRSVELIETGCQNLVQAMNERSTDGEFEGHFLINKKMDGTSASGSISTDSVIADSKLFENAAEYFSIIPLSDSETSSYVKLIRAFSGGSAASSPGIKDIAEKFAKHPKWGAYFGVKYIAGSKTQSDKELIYIDVNGVSSPNRYGHDVFLFELTDNCHMIPAGLAQISNVPADESGCSGHNVTNGLSCTSRVIKDGYKIEYMK